MVRSEKGRERNIRKKNCKSKKKKLSQEVHVFFFNKKPVYKKLEARAP